MKAVLHVFVVNHEHPSGVAALQTPLLHPATVLIFELMDLYPKS